MTTADKDSAFEYLRTTGDVLSFHEAAAGSFNFTLYRIGYEFPLNLMFILLGLAGSMIVSYMMSRRENAIYIVCGIKNRSPIGIEWIRCGVTSLVACTLVFLLSRAGILRVFFDITTYLFSLGIAAIFIAAILAIASTQIFRQLGCVDTVTEGAYKIDDRRGEM